MKSTDYMREYMKARRKKRRQKYIELLGGKCSNCGAIDNLQFDHVSSIKKTHDLNDIKDGNEKVILKELRKCVLLCAPCHLDKSKREHDLVNKDKKPSGHGRIWHYKHYKCRCDKCRKAMRDYLLAKNKG